MHPATNLTLDLLIWLVSLVCLILLAYNIVRHTEDYANSQYYKEDVKIESGLVTLLSCLVCVLPSRSVNASMLILILFLGLFTLFYLSAILST